MGKNYVGFSTRTNIEVKNSVSVYLFKIKEEIQRKKITTKLILNY